MLSKAINPFTKYPSIKILAFSKLQEHNKVWIINKLRLNILEVHLFKEYLSELKMTHLPKPKIGPENFQSHYIHAWKPWKIPLTHRPTVSTHRMTMSRGTARWANCIGVCADVLWSKMLVYTHIHMVSENINFGGWDIRAVKPRCHDVPEHTHPRRYGFSSLRASLNEPLDDYGG